MLVNVHHDSPAEHRRLLLAGVVFLAVLGLLGGLCVAVYAKVFQDSTTVVLEAERAGLQLARFGDVRLNGALVGQVRDIEQADGAARITLALEPEAAAVIPENASVQILPTTLFGQKFVSFVLPEQPSGRSLSEGSVIPAERVETHVELDRILADLFPLLRAVRPADLNATLNALASALEGRGEQLGRTLDELGGYLGAVQGSLPTLREDLEALADVADAYDDAAPDLLDVLANLTVTSRTVTDRRRDLDTFFGDVGGLAATSTRVLGDNQQDLVQVGEVTAPVLDLLATYSPQLPCLLEGAENYEPRLSKAFEGNQVKQYLELFADQHTAYDEDDRPVYGEVGRGPWCLGLPDPPEPIGPRPLRDGSDKDSDPPTSPLPYTGRGGLADPVAMGYAGTAGDQQVLNALLAGRSGAPAAAYGSLGSLLYGPVVRGEAAS